MTEAKNKTDEEGFRREVEALAFMIRSYPTRKQKEFEEYALRTMCLLNDFSRIPHLHRGFPIDQTNNVAESMNHAFKSILGYKWSTIEEIIEGGLRLMERQRNRVHE